MSWRNRVNLYSLCATAALLCLGACAHQPEVLPMPEPAIDASAIFDQSVGAQFPPGSSLTALRSALAIGQYVISDAPNPGSLRPYSATRKAVNIVCNLTWTISWNAAGDRISAIAGQYSAVCP